MSSDNSCKWLTESIVDFFLRKNKFSCFLLFCCPLKMGCISISRFSSRKYFELFCCNLINYAVHELRLDVEVILILIGDLLVLVYIPVLRPLSTSNNFSSS